MPELKVTDVKWSLGAVFEYIEALTSRFQFRDCAQAIEPACAALQAIEDDELDPRCPECNHELLRENATLAEKPRKDGGQINCASKRCR